MRLKPAGKLIILLIILGIAVGGYRLWHGRSASPGSESGGGLVEIPVLTTATKADWLQNEVNAFNQAHADRWKLTLGTLESREAMHAILDGKNKPVLWSPSSPIWIARLADVWSQQHNQKIVDMADPASFRVFLRSPIVFLTTGEKAAYFRRVLGGARPWASVRDLSLGRRRTPWGDFRFSHADPLNANSGMLTLGMILIEYGQQSGQSGSLEKAADDPRFVQYLKELERGLVYDAPAQQGSSPLTRAFADDPSSRDFITTYESSALALIDSHPSLAVVYPNPTAVSEQSVGVLSADWVTPQQKEGAQAFMTFLASEEALKDGVKFFFRPAQAGSTLSLTPELNRRAQQGFQESFTAVEMPSYNALNAAAYQWRLSIAHQPAARE